MQPAGASRPGADGGHRPGRPALWGLIAIEFLAFHIPGVWLFLFLLSPPEGSGGVAAAAWNFLLVSGWGFIHSLMARQRARACMARLVGDDFVKLLYTVVAGLTQCLMLYGWLPLTGTLWRAEGVLYWVLALLLLGAFGLVFRFSLLLDYLEVLGVRRILRRLQGAAPAAPALCLRGPYRHCRHPVYLATLASLWVGPVMTAGRFEFALLASLYILIGTALEERDTRRVLGEAYDVYRAHVPMWVPRWTPWEGSLDPKEAAAVAGQRKA